MSKGIKSVEWYDKFIDMKFCIEHCEVDRGVMMSEKSGGEDWKVMWCLPLESTTIDNLIKFLKLYKRKEHE